MAPTRPLRDALYEEMAERLSVVDRSVPERDGDYLYYTRTEPGKQYPYRCRKKGSLEAPEEIILDENELSEGHDFFRIGDFEVSPDQRLAAYSVDTNAPHQPAPSGGFTRAAVHGLGMTVLLPLLSEEVGLDVYGDGSGYQPGDSPGNALACLCAMSL